MQRNAAIDDSITDDQPKVKRRKKDSPPKATTPLTSGMMSSYSDSTKAQQNSLPATQAHAHHHLQTSSSPERATTSPPSRGSGPNIAAASLKEPASWERPYNVVELLRHLGFRLDEDGVRSWVTWVHSSIFAPHYQHYCTANPAGQKFPRSLLQTITQLALKNESQFDHGDQWLQSGSLSAPTAAIRKYGRMAEWRSAATLYRIYEDNRRAGSPASIVDTEGKPRWYALWGLTSWLISDSASFNTMVESRRAPIRTIYWNDNALLGPMCRNMKIVIDPKSSFTNTEEIAMPPLALRSPGIDPESTFDTPRLSNTPTINMMVEGPCSPAQPNHDQNIPPHQQAKHGTSQEAPISSPKTSFALPSDSTAVVSSLTADICPSTTDITNIPSQAHTVSEEPRNAIPTGIDKVAELRRLMESRLEQNRNKLPSSKDQFIEGVLVTKKAAEKLHLLKIQVRLAEKGLQEAQEKQEILKVAKEKQSLTAQKYLDCQKDLEHLAKMQEEKMIGLRNLNLPSLDETLAASMNPIVQGVVNKYPEILGSYVHFQSETSS